ncbi:MAG: D-alanine--D-alanine ligase [Myxococcota bacterium]
MKPGFTQEELKRKKVGVLYGGVSAEREVSLETGKSVFEATERLGLKSVLIDAKERLYERLIEEGVEIVFNALHGRFYEDGCVQGLLEMMKIPYTGTGVTGSALGMDKKLSRLLFTSVGLPMPPGVALPRAAAEGEKIPSPPFQLPVVVKPAGEGSSVGVSIVEDKSGWRDAFQKASQFHGSIIVEKYVKGREIQVAYLNGDVLGAIEVIPAVKFYDYEAKYLRNDTKYVFPAPITKKEEKAVFDITRRANEALGCEGVTRSDLILSESGEAFLLEVNTLPGMTSHSLVPKIADGVGISFDELVERILLSARLKG